MPQTAQNRPGPQPRGNPHRIANHIRLVSGHGFSRAEKAKNDVGFSPCEKGTGFSPYNHPDKMNPRASAPEGTLIESPTTSALCQGTTSVVPKKPKTTWASAPAVGGGGVTCSGETRRDADSQPLCKRARLQSGDAGT